MSAKKIPIRRLKLFKKSFVSDSIRLWNLFKAETREAISTNSFRKNISVEIVNPPSYHVFGKRFINIIQTKLRHKCIVHYDHYKRNISDTPFCSCGHNEDVYHFLYVKVIIKPETICLINFFRLT